MRRSASRWSAKAAEGFIDAGRRAKRMAAPSSGRSKYYKFEDKQFVGGETTDNGAKVRETHMSK